LPAETSLILWADIGGVRRFCILADESLAYTMVREAD
jgi:hypothetical protein